MDKISILGIILVFLPETIVAAFIGLLSIGKFSYFKNKNNYLRIAIFCVLAAVFASISRSLVRNIVEQLLVSVILDSLLFILVMRLKFYESMLSSIFSIVIVIVMESIFLPPILTIAQISISQVFANDYVRFLVSIPERVIQVILILLSLKFRIRIFDFDNTNIKKVDYHVQVFVSILSTLSIVFLVTVIAKTLLFDNGNFSNTTDLMLLRLNLYISLFVTIILLLAIKNTNEYYKRKNDLSNNEYLQNLEYLSNLVKEKKLEEATEIIDNLRFHIEHSEKKRP